MDKKNKCEACVFSLNLKGKFDKEKQERLDKIVNDFVRVYMSEAVRKNMNNS